MIDTQEPLGEVTTTKTDMQVVFRRRYARPIEKVWAAISTPERLEAWLAKADFEPRVGATIRLDWFGHNQMEGVIKAYDPPHRLAWTWPLGGRETLVSFELEALADGGCELVLTHTGLNPNATAGGVRSGWHAHLDGLLDAIDGRATGWDTIMARNMAVQPNYPALSA